ncbi:MAG: SocA family protein [Deltaproteobacteria bacterium]|jgi:hypothetical protein|nr:SocA family protein [Deltaproteobacteria bacterium]
MTVLTPLERLIDAMRFVIYYANINNLKSRLNATLLLKIIFFAEIVCLDTFGEFLTEVKMVKTPFGPVPDKYTTAISVLVNQQIIKVNKISNQTTYECLSDHKPGALSEEKYNILKLITHAFCTRLTAKALSNYIYENKYYQLAKNGSEIPIVAYLPHKTIKLSIEELAELDLLSDPFDVSEDIKAEFPYFQMLK